MLIITHWPYFIHLLLVFVQEYKEIKDDNITSQKITSIFKKIYLK